jgi:phosphate starvation-inducible protein PhoH
LYLFWGLKCFSTQIKTIISRMGRDSKCIISGDVTQKDTHREANGLLFCVNNFETPMVPGVGVVRLGYEDIKRNPKIAHILRIFDDNNY